MTIQLSNPEDHNSDGVPEEIRRTPSVLAEPDNVVELRGFKDRQVMSGYFDDDEALVNGAAELDDQGYEVYVTLNPVNPALLARANNRLVHRPRATTADHDITCRRWLLIDIDPVRPSGVAATKQEKWAAFERAKEVKRYLKEQGWPEPVVADSGNGFHLIPPIDLPNDPESRELVKDVLEALAFRFDDDRVKVDTGVHNAARIVRFYGTMNRKGDHTQERPHRRSKIKLVPGGSPEEQVVSKEKLEAVAGMRPVTPPERSRGGFLDVNFRQGFDLPAWIEEQGVSIKREGEWQQNSYRWVLDECPWNGHTDNAAYIVQLPSGAIAAGCHHNSCQGYGWRDLREQYEPGCYDRPDPGSDTACNVGDFPGGTKAGLPAVPSFPLAALPTTSRAFIEEAAASIGCPPEFIAVPMLVAFGAAIGNSRVLELKSGWTEGASLYAAVIASPGEKKTPAAKAATRPAWRQQAELKREHDEAMAAYLREKRAWDADRRRASREEEAAPEPPEEPTMRRAVVEDATVEALISRLEESPWGLLCAKDELTAWVRALDQYKGGKGSDRQFWLSVWSNFFVVVDRKGRKEPIMVPRPFVGLTGSIQPGVLSELKNYREDGLLDRFLFAYPDPMPSRWSDDEISEEVMARYQELYSRLYALGMVADENGEFAPEHLVLDPGAKEIFVEEVNSLREEMEHPGFPDHLKGPWSKLEAYLARLALILALVRIVESENVLAKAFEAVLEPDVEAAAELLKYFKAHARRVYAKLNGERPEYLLAEALKVFLREAGGAWEGQTSELYKVMKGRSAPGLPGGPVPFGKQLREIARRGLGIVLEDAWWGSAQVIKLALSTPGTPGKEGLTKSEHEATGGTAGTEGKTG